MSAKIISTSAPSTANRFGVSDEKQQHQFFFVVFKVIERRIRTRENVREADLKKKKRKQEDEDHNRRLI